MTRRKKYLANEMRVYILVRYIIGRETRLHDLGGGGGCILSFINTR